MIAKKCAIHILQQLYTNKKSLEIILQKSVVEMQIKLYELLYIK